MIVEAASGLRPPGRPLLVSAGKSGSPSLAASCDKHALGTRKFTPDITVDASTASHSITARNASFISDDSPFSFKRKRCSYDPCFVHVHEDVFIKAAGRSGLRDEYKHQTCLYLGRLTNENRAGFSPLDPACSGRAFVTSKGARSFLNCHVKGGRRRRSGIWSVRDRSILAPNCWCKGACNGVVAWSHARRHGGSPVDGASDPHWKSECRPAVRRTRSHPSPTPTCCPPRPGSSLAGCAHEHGVFYP